jgi:hypothetical protein
MYEFIIGFIFCVFVAAQHKWQTRVASKFVRKIQVEGMFSKASQQEMHNFTNDLLFFLLTRIWYIGDVSVGGQKCFLFSFRSFRYLF